MIDIKDRIKQVLNEGLLLNVSTVDESGPWVAAVRYIADDNFNVYWMSSINSRHSKAIGEDSRTAACITVNQAYGTQNFGIQIAGKAEKIKSPSARIVAKYFSRRNKPVPDVLPQIVKGSHSWYKLEPIFIELIDEENFGFANKQKIEF